MSDILVFGTGGQLANALMEELPRAQFVGQKDCNFEHPSEVLHFLERSNPKIIVNAAAYTNVDLAEKEIEKAYHINANSVSVIAEFAEQRACRFVHVSTDYVFDGSGNLQWTELSTPRPLSVYGASKLAGDRSILGLKKLWAVVFRVSWVYSPWGNNFLIRTLQWLRTKPELKVVTDQVGAPTSALDLARAIRYWIENNKGQKAPCIYNFTSGDPVSRLELTEEIQNLALELHLIEKKLPILKALTADFPAPAARPLNSKLSLEKWRQEFPQFQIPKRQESLRETLVRIASGSFPQ